MDKIDREGPGRRVVWLRDLCVGSGLVSMLLLAPCEEACQFWWSSEVMLGTLVVDFVFWARPAAISIVIFEIIFSFGEIVSDGVPIMGVDTLGGAGLQGILSWP